MTANAKNMPNPKGLSTQPVMRPHVPDLETTENFRSLGDYTTSGDYGDGGGSDEPIQRELLNSGQRQIGRQWMRKLMQERGEV